MFTLLWQLSDRFLRSQDHLGLWHVLLNTYISSFLLFMAECNTPVNLGSLLDIIEIYIQTELTWPEYMYVLSCSPYPSQSKCSEKNKQGTLIQRGPQSWPPNKPSLPPSMNSILSRTLALSSSTDLSLPQSEHLPYICGLHATVPMGKKSPMVYWPGPHEIKLL